MPSKWSRVPVGTGLALSAALGAVCGCHKDPAPKPQTSQNATPPVVAAPVSMETSPATPPATEPATQPASSVLVIGDKVEQFPQARARVLRVGEDQVTVVLYTADPDAAIDNDYQGNSFYLTMPLTDVKETPGALVGSWRYKSGTSDFQENTEGIFLHGLRMHLQPSDVLVQIQQVGATYRIGFVGQFLAFDKSNLQLPGVLTSVSGEITAMAEVKK